VIGAAPAATEASAVPGWAVPVIEIRSASRVYDMGGLTVPALLEADLRVDQGEFLAIVGPSGSGKSTLMNLIGCLDRPTSGEVRLVGRSVAELDDDGLAAMRSRFIGFIFQSYNLLPRTTALENVAAPLLYQGVSRRDRLERSRDMLERVGLGDRTGHQPTELSGGQQQRVAIARALVTNPPLILADEPTGNLDSHSGAEVMAILRSLHESGRTIVLITHDAEVASSARRQVHIRDGRLTA
jgi:putative ABC transport system ATP-binding protein